MRIVSLVPHATELLFALELDDEVVGVTHECDYPWAATELPKVTKNRLPNDGSAREIDEAVREQTLGGQSIYELDEQALRDLEPTLIVTQELCTVCAVSATDVIALAQTMDPVPEVVTLDPHTLGEALGDIRTIAGHTDRKDEDVLGLPGEPSEVFDWDVAKAAEPDIVLVMPCGRTALDAREEALEHWDKLASLGASRVIAVEASAYFSRPGPRLVDGLELLSALLHPTSGIEAPENSWFEVR